MSGVRSVAAVVVVVAAALSGCSGSSADEGGAVTPPRTDAPTTTAASPEPSSSTTDALVSVAERWRDHPEERPGSLSSAAVPVVDERWTGPRTFTDLDLSGQETVTMYLTCDRSAPFYVDMGVPEDPERYGFGSDGCSPASSSSGSYGLALRGPATQASVTVPEGVTYHLTVYGTPPTVDGTTSPDPSAP